MLCSYTVIIREKKMTKPDFLTPTWPAPHNIHAYTSLRHGGVSLPPYDSFNMGEHVGDNAHHVAANRELLRQTLQLPSEPCWLNQTHGTRVVMAGTDRQADASFTTHANIVCAIMTADCLPIFMCRRDGGAVAAIHAGWRGLADGIIHETLAVLPAAAKEIMVWLGPAIGPAKFEVGDEVRERFIMRNCAATTAFQPAARPNHWLANLYQLARLDLYAAGVTEIYGGQYCTYTDINRFYSYRREGQQSGRMVSLIWRS